MRQRIKKIFGAVAGKIPTRARISGAIQGVIGDKLPEGLQTEMAFFASGKNQNEALVTRQHVCIFVHGSSDTEAGWNVKPPALNFGEKLLLDFNAQPLLLRYNSGLAVSDNGEKLAMLISALTGRNKAIRRITLIGHSMGGLVIHSAIYHARAQSQGWIKKVAQVFLLGTPHAGAPLAKIAEKSEQILQFIPNPFTLIAASVIGFRSRGLKDLSQGQAGLPAEGKILLPRVRYVFIAGGVQKKPQGIMNRIIGDGMVRKPSAHSQTAGSGKEKNWLTKALPWLSKSRQIRIESLPGVNHLALRTSDDVYRIIAGYFRA